MKSLRVIPALVALVFFAAVVPSAGAQLREKPRFRHFSVDDGLAGVTVHSMIQDRHGFIWIAAVGVLHRFDGIEAVKYQANPDDPLGLPNDSVKRIFEDREGRIWLGTDRDGLLRYDPSFDGIVRYPHGLASDSSLAGSVVSGITQGTDGAIWVLTDPEGLSRLDPEAGRFETIPIELTTDLPPGKRYLSLAADGRGHIWVGTGDRRLHRIDEIGRGSTTYAVEPTDGPLVLPPEAARMLRPRPNGDVWIGTNGSGLFRYDAGRDAIVRVMAGPRDINSMLESPVIHGVAEDAQGDLWIGTQHGLARLTPSNGSFEEFQPDADDTESIPDDRIYAVVADRQGSIWIGTQNGISWADISSVRPAVFRHAEGDDESLWSNHVYAVEESTDGSVWVGLNESVDRLDRSTGRVHHFGNSGRPGTDIGSVRALHEDTDGRLWIGGFGRTRRLDPRTGRVESFAAGGPVPSAVRAFLRHPDGRIWFGGTTLALLDPKTQAGSRIEMKDGVWSLSYGADGRLWVATTTGLLAVRDETAAPDTSFMDLDGRLSRLIFSVHGAPDGSIWIGTGTDGLGRLDPENRTVTFFDKFNSGLPDNVVYGILPDDHGGLWVSTNGGLARLDPVTGDVRVLGAGSGIQSLEYNAGAFFKSTRGEMFFGGVNGFNVFHPDSLRDSPYEPQVALTGFHLFDDAVRPGSSGPLRTMPFEAEEIRLSHEQNYFSIQFAGLHFANPEANRYSYVLEGFDPEWHEDQAARSVSYTNVDPGEYVFRVRAASASGTWSSEGSAIRVVVLPPWWRTPWAYAIGFLLVASGGFSLDRYQRRRLLGRERERSAVRESHLRAELAEAQSQGLRQVSELRSRFFANVAHEFRTPLTLVLGPLEDIVARAGASEDPETVEDVQLALRNVHRLNRLVNELLDVSRLEADRLVLDRQPADLAAYVRDVAEVFRPLADRSGRRYEIEIPQTPVPVLIDRAQMEKVVLNLLSNAFKFVAEGGTVRVSIDGSVAGQVDLRVFNSGPGIEADKLERLFDRFYQTDEGRQLGQVGSGIGLSLVRDLVILHGGTTSVESEPSVGVTFRVTLPRAEELVDIESRRQPSERALAVVNDLIAAQDESRAGLEAEIDLDDEESGSRPTVLVIDDHAAIRTLVRRRLEPMYRVVEAADGVKGLDKVRRLMPDLVISDVMMPELDGYGLCTALKADPETSFIPVILLTARAAQEDRITGWDTGADAYLAKPFDDRELLSVVVNQLATGHRLRERIAGLRGASPVPAAEGTAESSAPIDEGTAENSAPIDPFLRQVHEVIGSRFMDEDFGVDDLVAELSMSRGSFYRRLEGTNAGPPAQLIRTFRLEEAARLLAAGDGNVGEVCYAAGFKNLAHFCKAFKNHYGVTPSAHARRE